MSWLRSCECKRDRVVVWAGGVDWWGWMRLSGCRDEWGCGGGWGRAIVVSGVKKLLG